MLDSFDVVLVVAAVIIAGIFRGFSGFGTGMILVPSLSLIYEPVVAVITVVLLELMTALQLVKTSLPHCHWRTVLPMALISSLTIPLGALVLLAVDANTMRIVIAILVMLSVVILSSGWRYKREAGFKIAAITGVSSGLIAGATSLGGLPVILYYLSSHLASQVARASMIIFLIITTMVSLVTYMFHGIITSDVMLRTATIAPVFIITIWLGGMLFGKVSESSFRKIILSLLGGISVMMLVTAYRM